MDTREANLTTVSGAALSMLVYAYNENLYVLVRGMMVFVVTKLTRLLESLLI